VEVGGASCCQSLHCMTHGTHDEGASISRHASEVSQGHSLTAMPGHLKERKAEYAAMNCTRRVVLPQTWFGVLGSGFRGSGLRSLGFELGVWGGTSPLV